ncbi:MAG: glutathione peroxidase [Bacteroidales bacterium]|nr:glutathione peroxidase [Bacteroidales bacterium]
MKTKILLITLLLPAFIYIQGQQSFYDFTVTDLYGGSFSMSSLKGKKVLIVNTASKCGLTPQYADLEKLYSQYKDNNFVIIGFPANNFLNQEPGTNEEIETFCRVNYGVSFPMMSKISVKGDNMHPLYKWLTSKSLNGVMDSQVEWNFQKYLIDENGSLAGVVKPRENPYSNTITDWLEGK